MDDLGAEMERCTSVKACIAVATQDTYGEYEEAAGWLTCLEELFPPGMRAQLLGEEIVVDGFVLLNELCAVAICRRGKTTAKVAPGSLEFLQLTPTQQLWLKAWKQWSHADA